LSTGFAFAHAGESTGNTSPLYSVSLFALMTTIMTDIKRPHYTAISPLPPSTFVSCFTSGSVLHSHEQAYLNDERSWAKLGMNMYHARPPTAHALLRTPFDQPALSSATLRIHFELNTNATALLGSLLWAVHTLAAAFLRRSSTTRFLPKPSDSLIALTFNTNPTFGDKLRNQVSLDSEAFKTPATTNWRLFRASNHDLERADFMMDEIVDLFDFLFPCLDFVL